jgi:hypothetical protein
MLWAEMLTFCNNYQKGRAYRLFDVKMIQNGLYL